MDTTLLHGDCLDWIHKLPKHSVDFIFADPPFGSIKEGKLKGIDKIIPPDKMWEAFRHVLKPSGMAIVFGTQPFISSVIVSNSKQFRYDLIWRKAQSGFLNCNNRPMREHQTIAVFSERAPVYNPLMRSGAKPYLNSGQHGASAILDRGRKVYGDAKQNDGTRFPTSIIEATEFKTGNLYKNGNVPKKLAERRGRPVSDPGSPVYNPIMRGGKAYSRKGTGARNKSTVIARPVMMDFENDGSRYYPTSIIEAPVYNPQLEPGLPYIVTRGPVFSDVYRKQNCTKTINSGSRQPSSVLTFKQATHKNVHPFEKPVPLCEWLIKTYTNEGMVVLDPTMGGGSSGVACHRLGRKFIGIELDSNWFMIARDRIYSTPTVKGQNENQHTAVGNL
jgi:DNA modification methylase